jgi:hypothetical protein
MNREIKRNWIKNFCAQLDREKKSLLIVDGHSSNVDEEIISIAERSNLIIFQLPSHTTHILQPLDQAFNKRLKEELVEAQRNCEKAVEKWVFLDFFLDAWQRTTTSSTIKSSFKMAGIWPIDFGIIDKYCCVSREEILLNLIEEKRKTISPTLKSSLLGTSFPFPYYPFPEFLNVQRFATPYSIPQINTANNNNNGDEIEIVASTKEPPPPYSFPVEQNNKEKEINSYSFPVEQNNKEKEINSSTTIETSNQSLTSPIGFILPTNVNYIVGSNNMIQSKKKKKSYLSTSSGRILDSSILK